MRNGDLTTVALKRIMGVCYGTKLRIKRRKYSGNIVRFYYNFCFSARLPNGAIVVAFNVVLSDYNTVGF